MVDELSFDPMQAAICYSQATACPKEFGAGALDPVELEKAIKATWLGLLHPNEDAMLAAQKQMEMEAAGVLEDVQNKQMADAIAAKAEQEHEALRKQTADADANTDTDEAEVAEGKGQELDPSKPPPAVVAQEDLDVKLDRHKAEEHEGEQKDKAAQKDEKEIAAADKGAAEKVTAERAEETRGKEQEQTVVETQQSQQLEESVAAAKLAEQEKTLATQQDAKQTQTAEAEKQDQAALLAKEEREPENDGKTRMVEQDGQAMNGAALLAKDEPAREQETRIQLAEKERDVPKQDDLAPTLAQNEPAPEQAAVMGAAVPTPQQKIAAVEDPIVMSENLLGSIGYQWGASQASPAAVAEKSAFAQADQIRAQLAGMGLISGLADAPDAHLAEHGSPTTRNTEVAQAEFRAALTEEAARA